VPVGVHGMGWKGVEVGEAFGATVTNSNGGICAGALSPHPASSSAAMLVICQKDFMEGARVLLAMGMM